MTQTEMKSRIEGRIRTLENRFSDVYKKQEIGERTCFVRDDGSLFSIDCLLTLGALVIGYADNEAEAKLNRFEDGDLFYLEGMDEETMFQAMLREIR